ncbi:MAG: heme-copper oxidase subunit III [Verrucomicrobiales bacterium]|nr:heme-copper oxidase subunit III [Verrucomicrobiales bacterium]
MEIPYEVTARRDTGLYNAKIGIWLFLASEVMLFGGLFSAYVFLRVGVIDGVDTPWPLGLDVHKQFVWIGFVNTIVLIASSVFVVFAWVSLKERNYQRFQIWMVAVVLCAAAFMVNKFIEYKNKLTEHHGIKLVDNSVMEGKIVHDTEKIKFAADSLNVPLQGGLPAFLGDFEGDFPAFKAVYVGKEEEGKEPVKIEKSGSSAGDFADWFYEARRQVAEDLAEERKKLRDAKKEGKTYQMKPVPTKGTVTPAAGEGGESEPFVLRPDNRKMVNYSRSEDGPDKLNYIDAVTVDGKVLADKIEYELHEINLQQVPITKQDSAKLWEIFESQGHGYVKDEFMEHQAERIQELRTKFKDKPIPAKVMQSAFVNLIEAHLHEPKTGEKKGGGDVHGEKAKVNPAADDGHDKKDDHGDGHHGHYTVLIDRGDVKFFGNHGPRYGNYYAIYFTMTALHGLHVVGGALVLAYFLIFGKKLYLKNPEHLANRVEVGGLFWHFVDLVWIFLFPIMYLL